eukprot:109677_1
MSHNRKHYKKKKRQSIQDAKAVPFGIRHVPKHPKFIRTQKFDEKLWTTILKHPDNEKYQHQFPNFVFEPHVWGEHNKQYKFQPSKIKGMRILIQISTIHAILSGKYYIYTNHVDQELEEEQKSNTNHIIIEIPKRSIIQSVSKTVTYTEQDLFTNHTFTPSNSSVKKATGTKIMVIQNDMLDVSKYVMERYKYKPAVLVMSSRTYPGGGYKNGAGAQEEDICRRSTLFCNLENPYNFGAHHVSYPLPEFGGVYSPNVLVLRHGIDQSYAFFDKHPLKMSFVSVYAYSSPNLDSNNRLSKSMGKRTMKKIETILRIAMRNKHKCVILSAFGCGAYENPPLHIAQLFKRVLMRDVYNDYFEMIVFAILNDKNTGKAHNPKGNVMPFSETFNVPIQTLAEHP